jgi:hypothetical protein
MRNSILSFLIMLPIVSAAQDTDIDFHHDKTYEMSPAGRVKLACSDARVTVVGSDRSAARVKIDRVVSSKGIIFGRNNDFHVDVRVEGGDLVIEEVGRYSMSGIIGYYREDYTIVLELPRGTSLAVKGDDGNFLVRDLSGSISLSLDDADVKLQGCTGADFRFALDDGDLEMDQGRGRIKIIADDADVQIQSGNFVSVDVEIDDGELILETSLSDGGDYRVIAQDGLVALTVTDGGGRFDIRHDDARLTTEGGFEQLTSSESRTTLQLASGAAKVSILADDARLRLKALH